MAYGSLYYSYLEYKLAILFIQTTLASHESTQEPNQIFVNVESHGSASVVGIFWLLPGEF